MQRIHLDSRMKIASAILAIRDCLRTNSSWFFLRNNLESLDILVHKMRGILCAPALRRSMRPDAYLDGRPDRRINPMAAFIFLPELIAGARFITLLDPPPLSLSTCPPCLRPLSPSVRRSVVDGDDVKNDTVFVAPFSIKRPSHRRPASSSSNNAHTKAPR